MGHNENGLAKSDGVTPAAPILPRHVRTFGAGIHVLKMFKNKDLDGRDMADTCRHDVDGSRSEPAGMIRKKVSYGRSLRLRRGDNLAAFRAAEGVQLGEAAQSRGDPAQTHFASA